MKTFPMFLRVADRPVIIVGGGEQAAQKCRLMLKTEARITVCWPELDDELHDLAARGRITWHKDPVTAATFKGAALAFIATGCPGSAAALHGLAEAAGAVVNVVDQPDLCSAITPSIVDRDPVVVAIGTEGTAPVLARQIKSRMETLLEPQLGGFAALAGRMRGAVARSVPRAQRRAFWRWAFSDQPRKLHAQGAERDAAALLKAAIAGGGAPDVTPQGSICLIGAGPGAADLLTLRAVKRLQEADVIFYDRLVDPEVLELARRDAERIYVGKAVGACKWPQEKIDAVIVAAARSGQNVVRLKSGDPMLFGRAEEELAAARANGIPVEIVPGVTAASASAATLGRSLSERGAIERVTFATGTCRDGDAAPLFAETLRPGTTLALYMAVAAAPRIQAELLSKGLPGTLEVDVVSQASQKGEKILHCTLGTLSREMEQNDIANPAVIFIRHPKAAAAIARPRPQLAALSA
ncbi:siroheme synthase CysG [Thalassococcus sp. S3]|uniref:siroheme synthase CysG n=1 Tax=Thalassococcus sp. S3 TaxID=2017482 RepID=UPI0010242606|nr:siroheme synthase CysG [Thalassococcus sp. S3]QBF30024.1 uroporphyrinogen-III C-methyltransferase [Thalassococcus sp. S3]